MLMNTIVAILVTLVLTLQTQAQEQHHPHWSYKGDTGPDHWSELSPEFAACKTGREQSPIDISNPVTSQLPALRFEYKPVPLRVVDNGHTIQVTYSPGSWLTVGDKRFQLLQFHFHRPSEERINGKQHEMVVHLVHTDDSGNKAVVAVLLDQGKTNSLLHTVFQNVPPVKGREDSLRLMINAKDLLPANLSYYTFRGSLTTPPCTEGVTWLILQTSNSLASDDLARFAALYPNNSRQVQPLNDRKVFAGR